VIGLASFITWYRPIYLGYRKSEARGMAFFFCELAQRDEARFHLETQRLTRQTSISSLQASIWRSRFTWQSVYPVSWLTAKAWQKLTELSNWLRWSDQYDLHVFTDAYRCWYLWHVFEYWVGPPVRWRRPTVQAGE
jgi:hypothetical protein